MVAQHHLDLFPCHALCAPQVPCLYIHRQGETERDKKIKYEYMFRGDRNVKTCILNYGVFFCGEDGRKVLKIYYSNIFKAAFYANFV